MGFIFVRLGCPNSSRNSRREHVAAHVFFFSQQNFEPQRSPRGGVRSGHVETLPLWQVGPPHVYGTCSSSLFLLLWTEIEHRLHNGKRRGRFWVFICFVVNLNILKTDVRVMLNDSWRGCGISSPRIRQFFLSSFWVNVLRLGKPQQPQNPRLSLRPTTKTNVCLSRLVSCLTVRKFYPFPSVTRLKAIPISELNSHSLPFLFPLSKTKPTQLHCTRTRGPVDSLCVHAMTTLFPSPPKIVHHTSATNTSSTNLAAYDDGSAAASVHQVKIVPIKAIGIIIHDIRPSKNTQHPSFLVSCAVSSLTATTTTSFSAF